MKTIDRLLLYVIFIMVLMLVLSDVFAQNVYPDTIRMVWPDSNGWIDVRDSLPPTGRHVLTYVKLCYRFMPDLPRECHSFHYVTSYDGLNLPYDFNLHEIRDHNYGTEQVAEVTHWQPLPPKPEDK